MSPPAHEPETSPRPFAPAESPPGGGIAPPRAAGGSEPPMAHTPPLEQASSTAADGPNPLSHRRARPPAPQPPLDPTLVLRPPPRRPRLSVRSAIYIAAVVAVLGVVGGLTHALRAEPGYVRVLTGDVPARVSIDGVPVGTSPVRTQVQAGPHVIHVDAPRHRALERRVAVERGATMHLEVALEPEEPRP